MAKKSSGNEEENAKVSQNDETIIPDAEVKAEFEDESSDEEEPLDLSEDEDDGSEAKIAELENRYVQLFAEYDNFRKRTAREKTMLYADAVAEVSGQWLGVLDNIERAAQAGENMDENSIEKVVQGISLIGKQASDAMTKIGIEEIKCERGTPFDPELHEAVMHVDDDALGEQQIAAVFQKGYKYKDRVIRHAIVQVAN